MSDAVYTEQHVFDGGPPLRLQRSLGLVKPDQPRVVRRALIGAFLAWMPLALLATVQSLLFADGSAGWFFSDFSVHARYLVALPALVLAEIDCIPRLERIVVQFVEVGLIADADMPRYRAAIDSSRRLLDSRYGDVLVLIVAYICAIAVVSSVPVDLVPAWQRGVSSHYSPAGWWHILFSFPLLIILFLGWLWRLLVWGRFLVLVAALHLQLLPSHPDCVGGLQFVSISLRGFRLIGFALSAVVAGSIADWVVYHDISLGSFKFYVIGLGVFLLILMVGPLTVFVTRLRQAKIQGMFTYGALANRMGREFESKWLKSHQGVDRDILEKPDFSATTDYFSVAANVYQMREMPFTIKDVVTALLPACIPFLFVALLEMPFQIIFESVVKLLL